MGERQLTSTQPKLSLVIAVYEMQREIERTILSLSPSMQRDIEADDYELIVVDNGSPTPLERDACEGSGAHLRWLRIDPASASPAAALNQGIEMAEAPLVGAMIDGARLATPGLLSAALDASLAHARGVIASLGFHLGPDLQSRSAAAGYDQQAEDELLEGIGWNEDGYRLFEIAVPAASSRRGWFEAPAESNALFMRRGLWRELGGFDEAFQSPGGGLVNLDLFARACSLADSQLVHLMGEGTFHQIHGGISTNAEDSNWERFNAEYTELRGEPAGFPAARPLIFGSASQEALEAMRD